MANLGFNIRWSDNTAQLKKNLAEGLDQIETTRSAVDRIAKSLGGENLIRAAHNYAAALQKIGGEAGALSAIEKATSADRQRGIALLEKTIEKYGALGKAAPAALREILTAAKAVEQPLKVAAEDAAALQRQLSQFGGGKVATDARALVTAVTQLGGATKLTAAEQKQVNAIVTEAIAKYQALGQQAPKAMLDLAAATKQAETPTTSYVASFGKLVASYVTAQAIIGTVKTAFHAVTGFIEESITAANEAEKSQAQLVAALRAQGTAAPSVIKAYQQYAEQLQRTTIFQDDALAGAEALLVQVGGVMPRDMEKALTAVTNLASGLGKDLNAATLLVAKAAEGNTAALKKSGVVIDETGGKAKDFGKVLDAINAKFGGQAEAIAGTYAGRLSQLKNAFNDVEESIGRLITQNQTVLSVLGRLTGSLGDNKDALEGNAHASALISDAVITLVRGYAALEPLIGFTVKGFGYLTKGFFEAYAASINLTGILDKVIIRLLQLADFAPGVNLSRQIEYFQKDYADLANRYEQTKQAGDGALQSAQSIATALAASGAAAKTLGGNLDATRGHVLKFSTAGTEDAGVWDRQTKSVLGAAEAQKKFAEELKRNTEAVRKVEGGNIFGLDGLIKIDGFRLDEVGMVRKRVELNKQIQNDIERTSLSSQFGYGAIELTVPIKINRFALDDVEVARKRVELVRQIRSDIERPIDANDITLPTAGLKLIKPEDLVPKTASFARVLAGTAHQLPDLFIKSFTGGGSFKGALQALGTDFGQQLFGEKGSFASFTKQSTTGLSKVFGSTIGQALGAALPGIGALIGPAISGLGKLFGKLTDAAGRKTNDLRDAFQASFGKNGVGGSLDELIRGFTKVGLNIDDVNRLLHAGTEKELQKVIDTFSKATSTQKTAFGILNKAVDKYGFSISELGPAFRSQKLQEQAGQLYEDFKLLTASGIDTETVLRRMSGVKLEIISREEFDKLDEVQQKLYTFADGGFRRVEDWGDGLGKLVHDAIRTGTALPEALRPIVDQMIDLGLITRDDGTAFGSLEDTGLSFTGTLSDGFRDIVTAIDELTTALKLGLGIGLSETEERARSLRAELERLEDIDLSKVPGFTDKERDNNRDAINAAIEKRKRDLWDLNHPGEPYDPDRAHSGALVVPGGLRKFHTGISKVLPAVPRYHLGVNEVPAILKVGEAVLNERAVANLGTEAIGALNHGFQPQALVSESDLRATGTYGGGRSVTTNNYVTIQAWNGQDVMRTVNSDQFMHAFAKGVTGDRGSIRRAIKRASK